MTFGQKLKRLRTDNNLTQDELADKIFVTRTAVSKWETDKGYPSIDSLKLLAALFGCTLDELMRDADLQNKHFLEERKARRCYFAAVGCFVSALLFAVLSVGARLQYLWIASVVSVVGYAVCAYFARPAYKRKEAQRHLLRYVIAKLVPALLLLGVIVCTVILQF